jgi:DmsE family decaheme c-type cytochrome
VSVYRNLVPLALIALFATLIALDVRPSSAQDDAVPVTAPEATPSEDANAVDVATDAETAAPGSTGDESETQSASAPADPDAADEEAAEELGSIFPWHQESPHWVPGQEFAAVRGAPFIGSAECVLCHEDYKLDFLHTAHARTLTDETVPLERQGCEMCHGAGGAHAVLRSRGAIFAFDWEDQKHADNICLRCHEWMTTEREWERTTHAKAGLTCVECHNPHQSTADQQVNQHLLLDQQDRMCAGCHADVARDFTRFSHHPVQVNAAHDPGAEGMHCTDCHDVHAGHGDAMLETRRVSDTCIKCHLDKGGPFRFVHMATEEAVGDGCTVCHAQHGSSNENLLVASGRALCMQCHADKEDHEQPLTCWAAGCHVDVHGSNHNLYLLREVAP